LAATRHLASAGRLAAGTHAAERAILGPVQRFALALTLGAAALGCAPSKPPRWAEGGAALVIPNAHFSRGDNDAIEIRPDGQVLEGGSLLFKLDRVGRVVDEDYEPVAILMPDGRVEGTDDRFLGQVGVANASPAERGAAWLSVAPNDGHVTYFDEEGERSLGGQWTGCGGPALRTCTYVTHLIALRNYTRRQQSGVSVGVGIGIGF